MELQVNQHQTIIELFAFCRSQGRIVLRSAGDNGPKSGIVPQKCGPKGERSAMRGLPAENLITSQWRSGWKFSRKSEPRQRHIFHINEMLLIVHLTLVKCDLIVSANAKGQDSEKRTFLFSFLSFITSCWWPKRGCECPWCAPRRMRKRKWK